MVTWQNSTWLQDPHSHKTDGYLMIDGAKLGQNWDFERNLSKIPDLDTLMHI